jgi:hypothetical protein
MGGRFGDLGLEGDAEAGAGGGRKALQGFGGRPGATTLKAGDYGLGSRHSAGELGLRESGFRAGLDDGAGELEFGLQGFVGLAIGGFLQPFVVKVVDLSHGVTSRARFRARLISRRGVFSVFFTKTLTATTRWRVAVT